MCTVLLVSCDDDKVSTVVTFEWKWGEDDMPIVD